MCKLYNIQKRLELYYINNKWSMIDIKQNNDQIPYLSLLWAEEIVDDNDYIK